MDVFWLGGLRVRLMVLIILAVAPALGIILHSAAQQREHALNGAGVEALDLAREASRQQEHYFRKAHYLLLTLSMTTQVRTGDAAGSAQLFASLLKDARGLGNIAAATPEGDVFASGVPGAHQASFKDRPWFQRLVQTRLPVRSEYLIGRVTGKPAIVMAHPVLDEKGSLLAALAATIDLSWLNQFLPSHARLPTGASLLVFDRNGVILALHPGPDDSLGRTVPSAPLVQTVVGQREGTARLPGWDGVPRLFGFTQAVLKEHDAIFVCVGIPEEEAFAKARQGLIRDLLWLGVAAALAMAAAWLLGDRLLVRPMSNLLQATRRLAEGDLTARSGLPRGRDELSLLAGAFDAMAESLAWQYTELQQAMDNLSRGYRALRMLSDSNQTMIRAVDETKLMAAVCRIIVEVGGYKMAWVGLAQQDEGKTVLPAARWGDDSGYVNGLAITWADSERGRGPTGTAIRTGKPVASEEIAKDSVFAPWRAAALERGYGSAMALPLIADGETLGALTVYAGRPESFHNGAPESFHEEEIKLLVELADDLAFGIRGLRARRELQLVTEELRRHRDDLEGLVQERTRELRQEMEQRKLAQQGQERFVQLVENSSELIMLATPEGRVVYLNQAAKDVAGLPAGDQGQGMYIFDLMTEDSRRQARDTVLPQVWAGGRWAGELRLEQPPGGSPIEVEASIFALTGAEAEGPLLAAVMRDVTKRKQAEAERDRFFSISNDMLCIAGMDGLFRQLNPAWTNTLGWSAEELKGKPWLEFVHPEDKKATIAAGRELLAGRAVQAFENRYLAKDGSYRWLAWTSVPLSDQGLIYAVARDVTEAKQADQALRESKRALSTLMGNLPGMAYRCQNDPKWSLEFASQGCLSLTGYQPSAFLGEGAISFADLIHTDDRAMVWREAQEAIAADKPFQLTYRIITAGGEEKWVWEQGVGVYSDRKELQALEGFVIDISQQKRAAEKLAEQTEELARSNADLEQFAYAASHDLQEPLRIVTSYLQLLERRYKGKLDAEADKFIGQAVGGAARMRNLIQDLLAYSRVGTRAKPLQATNCESIMEDVLANLRIAIEGCGAVVTAGPLPTVMADPSQLGQLFQNLIGNALKFRGQDPPRVEVSAEKKGGEWVFCVRDNGIGIESQFAERIFGIFQRLHTRTEYPGTGIGLAICKKIVERHRGRIWVESEPGRGSAFHFTIPAEEGGER